MLRTLVPEAGLRVGPYSAECPDDLHVQRVLILILRVLEERSQLHFYTLQQLHRVHECRLVKMFYFQYGDMQPVLTSFCVTVSMMVPKAGMVDILTELEARKQSFTPSMHKYVKNS